MSAAMVLELSEGCELVIDGEPWRVEKLEPYWGSVTLRSDDGDGGRQRQTSIAALMRHRDCRVSSRSSPRAAGRGRQLASWKDLTGQQQGLVELRLAHLLEAETGFRSGDPFRPAPGEPRPEYDPALVPLVTDRREAKVAELAALREREPEHARLLGLGRISLRTLERWAARYYRWGVMGCADDRWLRPCTGHQVPEPVREAIYAVRAVCLHGSTISMLSKEKKIRQYVREKYGDRVLHPTDKQACERAFGAIQSLLFEQLPGYRGIDVADRGADPEGDAVLTLAEIEHLVATWIVGIWQNRKFGEYGPGWDPGGDHSPNTLFAAAMAQGGFSLEIPGPELYYELLPAHHVKIHPRGVKIRGLWYDGPALNGLRGTPSTRGGAHKRSWVIRSDRRDASTLPGGGPRTSPRSSPKTGTPATSRRSPASAPYSPAARPRSGWSR